ncbi:hypothetical protein PG984_011376 [Apiospora sp. TS-2023a]
MAMFLNWSRRNVSSGAGGSAPLPAAPKDNSATAAHTTPAVHQPPPARQPTARAAATEGTAAAAPAKSVSVTKESGTSGTEPEPAPGTSSNKQAEVANDVAASGGDAAGHTLGTAGDEDATGAGAPGNGTAATADDPPAQKPMDAGDVLDQVRSLLWDGVHKSNQHLRGSTMEPRKPPQAPHQFEKMSDGAKLLYWLKEKGLVTEQDMDAVYAYENDLEKMTMSDEWVDEAVKGMVLTNEFNVPAPVDETADHRPMVGQLLGTMLGLMSPNPKRIDRALETAFQPFSKPEADLLQILSDVADESWRLGTIVEAVRLYIPELQAGPLSAGSSTELLRLVGDFHHPIVVGRRLLHNAPDELLATLTPSKTEDR